MQDVSYSVAIATCDRFPWLVRAVESALRQTVQPLEIIVVDSSDDAKDRRTEFLAHFQGASPRLLYLTSQVRSSTCQRNAAIDACSGEIVFFIDDDCLMYPDYADQILSVYRADSANQVVGVSGTLARCKYSESLQSNVELVLQNRHYRRDISFGARLWNRINKGPSLYRWKGKPTYAPLPEALAGMGCQLRYELFGGMMAFRRNTIVKERFDPDMLYYVAMEDLDASYRCSFHGLLVNTPHALLYHDHKHSKTRLDHFLRTSIQVTNNALWMLKHSNNDLLTKIRFFFYYFGHFPGALLSDLRGWPLGHFQKSRGVLHGLAVASYIILFIPLPRLSTWYQGYLTRLFELNQKRLGAN